MQSLAPEYLAEIARQLGSLSAFLGGFAAAFLATLLTLSSARRTLSWTIASAAFAAVAFIVTVIAATKLAIVLHAQAPAQVAQTPVGSARIVAVLGFLLGTYALLLSIGLSGWLRSRRMGWLTALLAALGGVVVTSLLISL